MASGNAEPQDAIVPFPVSTATPVAPLIMDDVLASSVKPVGILHPASAGHWSSRKKMLVVTTGLFMNFNTTASSSLPSGAIDTLTKSFGVVSNQQKALPVGIFLVGYIFGPIIFAPISESFGRRICFLSSFALFTIFTLACALAPSWPLLLVFRFLVGVGAAAPQTVLGGMFADIFPDVKERGNVVMVFGLLANLGPLCGAVIAGFSSQQHWQWMFWISLIGAGVNWPLLVALPETFEPILVARYDRKRGPKKQLTVGTMMSEFRSRYAHNFVSRTLTRPLRMFWEPLVFFTDLFLLYQYTVFFLYFEAYPFIFKGTYKMSAGLAAVMQLPIGFGAIIAMCIFFWWERFFVRNAKAGKAWAQRPEYRRLPLACAGGPFYAISQFWLGWTSSPNIHPAVPALSGVFLGIGIDLTFMALTNYLTDAYGIYSASALTSSVFSRNLFAAVILPLAAEPMYQKLHVGWACTTLGIVCSALSVIPFIMLRFGPAMRDRSKICRLLEQHASTGKEYRPSDLERSTPLMEYNF